MKQLTPPASPAPADRVCLHAISKRYGSVTVLDNVSFSIKAGEIHGLLGANGAGKSTLCKILSGLTHPSAGQLFLDDKQVEIPNKKTAERLGIEIVQQELNLIPTLTVAENLLLSRLPQCCGVISRKQLHRHAKELLAKMGLDHLSPTTPTRLLGIGQQQLIEIAKSLRYPSKLLVLDEPTASLSSNEANHLFHRIEELTHAGTSILYISHRLDEVKSLCDRITILRDGKHVLTEATKKISTTEMVAWMSGDIESIKPITPSPSKPAQAIALRIVDLCCGPVRNITLDVKQGEILGVTGLVGSGRTELLRAIFGADRASSGAIYLNGSSTPCRFTSPAQAVAAGLAMVTEDRKSTGLILSHSIQDNAILASLKKSFSRWGLLRRTSAHTVVTKTCNDLATKYESLNQFVATLSGGNQQKVVIAKWLLSGANIFLLDEPTKGIDVAARHIIHDVIRKIAVQGAAILVVSSDTDELFPLCDRIAVMSNGMLTAQFDKRDFDKMRITEAAFIGHSSHMNKPIEPARVDEL
ncbi:MAG: sugar ABC transporter ATP-binding protein [Pirellula sp.]|jgi:ribose transport system ATP-binding protein